jgi:hypothetical protein
LALQALVKGQVYAPRITAGIMGLLAAEAGILSNCSFDGSTPVIAKNGLKRIDQIDVNELVLARNEKTGKTSWRQVEDRMQGYHPETVYLTVRGANGKADETILTSINHPFFVKDKGWVDAAALTKCGRPDRHIQGWRYGSRTRCHCQAGVTNVL